MLFSSSIIDFCIGMAVFYLILTLVCTMINEYIIEKWRSLRAKTLLEGISGLFYDAQKVYELYDHPLIRGLYRDEKTPLQKPSGTEKDQGIANEGKMAECKKPFEGVIKYLPSYIPARTFTAALLDILARPSDDKSQTWEGLRPGTCEELRQVIVHCQNDRIKGVLLPLIDEAQGSIDKARLNIEKWYDDAMDRVSGWFKRCAKVWLLGVAAIVCILLNADSIMVGKMLWQDKGLRDAFVADAGQLQSVTAKSATPNDLTTTIKKEMDKLSPFPLGWVCPTKEERSSGTGTPVDANKSRDPRAIPCKVPGIVLKLIGLFFTTLAISLGAPFWTGLLNSFVNLRRTGNVPPKAGANNK